MNAERYGSHRSDRLVPVLVYGLFLASFVTVGLAVVIGGVIAFLKRGDVEPWANSHLTNAIYAAGYGVLYFVLASVPVLISFGLLAWIIYPLIGIWFFIRTLLGLIAAIDGRPYPNPRGFII